MATKVQRSELLDYQTWMERRAAVLPSIMEEKQARRIHLGDHLTFLFENATTVRYQIQEMMRVERIVREADILHELKTYNDLLGDAGELGCVLMIEIPTPEERDQKLKSWLKLPYHLYVELEDGTRVSPSFDAAQIGEERLSSVQYLKFNTGGQVPVAVGCDLDGCTSHQPLSDEQRAALRSDVN